MHRFSYLRQLIYLQTLKLFFYHPFLFDLFQQLFLFFVLPYFFPLVHLSYLLSLILLF